MTEELIYPRPGTRNLAVHTVLHALQEDEALFQEFLADPDQVTGRFGVDDEARALLRACDYRGMVSRGVHPILVVHLQRHIEWGMKAGHDDPAQ
ncbi:MAG: hypothetical protein ACRDPO_15045 [Streptosporangiaceae bacterium]